MHQASFERVTIPEPLFPLGRCLLTPGAICALLRAVQLPVAFLIRHASGDWGLLDSHDWAVNQAALRTGERLFSRYLTAMGEDLWVTTEADRSVTTILLPSDY
jgi:hypothetical protein